MLAVRTYQQLIFHKEKCCVLVMIATKQLFGCTEIKTMDIETIRKLKECCAREAALRKNVYPKWVNSGKMTQEKADEEIYLMQLAAASFNKILQGKAPEIQQTLFDLKPFEPPKQRYY